MMTPRERVLETTTCAVSRYLEGEDAWWKWDGHKHVAQLTSGKLSNFYANLTPLYYSSLLEEISNCFKLIFLEQRRRQIDGNWWVVGPAMGGIWLARSLAQSLAYLCAFTEKVVQVMDVIEGPCLGETMELKRFDLGSKPYVILIEDVFTTGGTTRKTVDAILRKHPDVRFHDCVYVVVNRSGAQTIAHTARDGRQRLFRIEAILDVPAETWDSVDDLPEEMKGCVPLRPKGNWKKLVEEKL